MIAGPSFGSSFLFTGLGVVALLANALVRAPLLSNPASSPLAFALFGIVLARTADPARSLARRAIVVASTLLLAAVSVRALAFVSLDELREMPELAQCRLIAKGNRLSVIPLTDVEFDAIVAASKRAAKRR